MNGFIKYYKDDKKKEQTMGQTHSTRGKLDIDTSTKF
jgi:hypothetical protein